jgi:hypothetical protein
VLIFDKMAGQIFMLSPSYQRHDGACGCKPNGQHRNPRGAQMRVEKIVRDKSSDNILKRAEDCFELAKTQHDAADLQHSIAARQLNNAGKQHDIAARQFDNVDNQHANAGIQEEIAAKQHESADQLDVSAMKLRALGRALVDDAAEVTGETELVERGKGEQLLNPSYPRR